MTDFVIAIYCFIDDFHKATQPKEEIGRKVSDAEILTTAVVATRYFSGNFVHARQYMRDHHGVHMIDKSGFNRRLHALEFQLWAMFRSLGETIKNLHTDNEYLIDSFPVKICHNIRIPANRILNKEEVYRGRCASKREYFYGFKVQVVTTSTGIPVEVFIGAGSFADITAFQAMEISLPEGAILYADSGYTDYDIEDHFKECGAIDLQVCRKKNSKRKVHPAKEFIKEFMRKKIETAFSKITKWFPQHIHAVTPKGFLLKLTLFLFAYTLDLVS